ncbi:MAG: hypothetical protein NXI20_09360 [bacterium]|nr:hypothetical protein [bacterium]
MKKQISTSILSLVILLSIGSLSAIAQPGWEWGEDVDKAKEQNALYTDNLKAGNFEAAKEPLLWLLENTPNLNVSLYINGAKIYEGLADATADKAQKKEFQMKALEMYDKRIEYFGDEDKVLNRKGYRAYKFLKDDKTKYPDLLALYDRIFELNGERVYVNNLVAYMDVVRRNKLVGTDISDEQVLERYTIISDVIDTKLGKKPGDATLLKMADNVDKILLATIDLTCDLVTEIFGSKLEENPDVRLAKKIFKLMLTGKCTDSPLAFKAAQIVVEAEPNYGIYKFLAQRSGADGNTEEAVSFYEKAVELTDDNTKKSEVLISVARIFGSKGQKSTARSYCRKALSYDPANSSAYKLIGDLYMNSFNDCKKGVSKVEDRAVFIAAYKMYQRAGSSSAMASAKAQFPSIDEIFSEGYKEGQELSVGCWVNETVKLERRPAQ